MIWWGILPNLKHVLSSLLTANYASNYTPLTGFDILYFFSFNFFESDSFFEFSFILILFDVWASRHHSYNWFFDILVSSVTYDPKCLVKKNRYRLCYFKNIMYNNSHAIMFKVRQFNQFLTEHIQYKVRQYRDF